MIILFSGVPLALLLPETLNQKLPDTIEDTKSFGKNQVSFSLDLFLFFRDTYLKKLLNFTEDLEFLFRKKTDETENTCN